MNHGYYPPQGFDINTTNNSNNNSNNNNNNNHSNNNNNNNTISNINAQGNAQNNKFIGNPTIALSSTTNTVPVTGYITTATAQGYTTNGITSEASGTIGYNSNNIHGTNTLGYNNGNNVNANVNGYNTNTSSNTSINNSNNSSSSQLTSNLTSNLNYLNNTINKTQNNNITTSNHKSTKFRQKYGPQDFEVLKLLGKGTFGHVYQVRKKTSHKVYAMKVLSKNVIVKKNEIAHTIGERNILVRTASKSCPFIVGLKFSFQTVYDLYLVTDFMNGGELFWHLQKEGRFAEPRAKFYIAELVMALEYLHDIDIVYRDLKPENILLDSQGHIALCDFGLSKADLKDRTNTFCGTTEYLAPELLLDETGYTKMVDFWSLGVLIFEMCCGWSPFFAEDNQKMYQKIAFGKVKFPRDVLSPEGRSFVKGLLNRNPRHRLGAIDDGRELRAHPFLNDVNWELLRQKKIQPPFKPMLQNELDTSNFDPQFTSHQINHSLFSDSTSPHNTHQQPHSNNANHALPHATGHNNDAQIHKSQHHKQNTPLSSTLQMQFQGFTYVDQSALEHMGHAQGASIPNSYSMSLNKRKMLQNSYFMEPGSFIPGDPSLPPDENVIDDFDDSRNKGGNVAGDGDQLNNLNGHMHMDQGKAGAMGMNIDVDEMDDDDEHMGFQFD
ncbi:Serine/threonine-protein kinase [Hanseniaspora vineae]